MATDTNWYDNATVLRGFQAALVEAGVLTESEEIKGFLSHPQRYNEYYDAWEENDFPDPEHDNWDDFVAAVSDDEDNADDGEGE